MKKNQKDSTSAGRHCGRNIKPWALWMEFPKAWRCTPITPGEAEDRERLRTLWLSWATKPVPRLAWETRGTILKTEKKKKIKQSLGEKAR